MKHLFGRNIEEVALAALKSLQDNKRVRAVCLQLVQQLLKFLFTCAEEDVHQDGMIAFKLCQKPKVNFQRN